MEKLRGNLVALGSTDGVIFQGKALNARTGGIRFEDAKTDFSKGEKIQWFRDGEPIKGKTSKKYTIQKGDIGSHIHLELTLTDEDGNLGKAVSPEYFCSSKRIETLRCLYTYLLDRPADTPGLVFWADVLKKKEQQGVPYALASTIKAFMSSPGYKKEMGIKD